MAKIRKANVVLTIPDDEVKNYLNFGYSVIDESGEVIEEAVPTDIYTLQKAYRDNKIKIQSLEQAVADLRKELERKKRK